MKSFLMLMGLLVATSVFSQQDQKAKSILDEVSKKTKTYKSISATFSYTQEGKDKKVTEKQEGSIMVKGDKYKVEIAGQIIFCDGKTVWTYLKESNEVQINTVDPKADDDKITPKNIFTIYEKGFKYEFVKEENAKSGVVQIVKLYPTDPKKKSYHTAVLKIDKTKKQVLSMSVQAKDGSSNTYLVKKFTPNAELADNLFTFNKANYPGVEVVDLR